MKVCPQCANDMELGKAIVHKDFNHRHEGGCRCLYTPPLISSDTLKMIDCWKCISCGYSEEIDEKASARGG